MLFIDEETCDLEFEFHFFLRISIFSVELCLLLVVNRPKWMAVDCLSHDYANEVYY